jgi:hypothetical protein
VFGYTRLHYTPCKTCLSNPDKNYIKWQQCSCSTQSNTSLDSPPGHSISTALDAQWPIRMHTTSSLLHQTCSSDIATRTHGMTTSGCCRACVCCVFHVYILLVCCVSQLTGGTMCKQRKCWCSVTLDCITHPVKHAFLIQIRIT